MQNRVLSVKPFQAYDMVKRQRPITMLVSETATITVDATTKISTTVAAKTSKKYTCYNNKLRQAVANKTVIIYNLYKIPHFYIFL